MKFQNEIIVYGMKYSKGEYEGTAFDSTKVYTLVDMDARKGQAIGQASVEYAFGESTNFAKFSHLPYPFKAVGEFEIVTNGRNQQTVLVGLKPVSPAKPS
jgi:hypothetical protein